MPKTRWRRTMLALLLAEGLVVGRVADVRGDDRGVVGRKLLLMDRYASGRAKVLFTAGDGASGAIHHGSGSGSPADLSGTVTICPLAAPTNAAVYALPAPWLRNGTASARYLNAGAIPGGPGVRTVKVRAGRALRVVAKNLGDGDAASGDDGASDLDLNDPPGTCTVGPGDGIHVEVSLLDATTATTHRMCTTFTVDSAIAVGDGTGCKVVSKTSAASACGVCGTAPTTTTTTVPPVCGAPNDATCGGTCAAGLVCVYLSFGPGGSGCGCVAPPVCGFDGGGVCGGNCPPACICWPGAGTCECVCA